MADAVELLYWDSCVFLSLINGHPDRAPNIATFIELAEKGKLKIVTSMLSIVEVAFASQEQAAGVLSPEAEAAITGLWRPPSPITLHEFHVVIANGARELMRSALLNKTSLKPADAIHLSTARTIGAARFHTYDEGLDKYAGLIGAKIERPLPNQISLPLPTTGQQLGLTPPSPPAS